MGGIHTFRELKPSRLTQKLIATIIDKLSALPHSDEFQQNLKKKKNENQHSMAFCLFMTNSCQAEYYFNRENAQKGSYTIDIGIYKGANLIFVIEAKVLPTPLGTKSQPRTKHEYVYGKGAGIQRFRDGNHGVDNEDNLFDDCGMLGFIKENGFEFWLERVNQWILDAEWQPDEQLQQISDKNDVFLSAHPRKDHSMIRLHHFWIKV
jgi:hypothetical protein